MRRTIWGFGLLVGLAVCAAAFTRLQNRPANGGKGAKKMEQTVVDVPGNREMATLAGGCFWCTEAIFQDLKGVDKVTSGYAGGHQPNPTYKEVCAGTTGHAEALQIIFDPATISYKDLLRIHFTTHDPTTLNRQGADVGTQYRSAVFTHNEDQAKAANEVIDEVTKEGIWPGKIVTEVTPFTNFYPAEDYHQNYYKDNPNQGYCRVVIEPKVRKFREKYRDKMKS